MADEVREPGDLQKAFLMFKRKRQTELKQPVPERSQDELSILRAKFVKQVKSYLGVPYHRRYHTPESEYYNAPLYLDCCGLVRKVCHDLQQDLGFVLGGWNQGYQFDTLPIKWSTSDQMRAGDLVFISGTYIKPHPKKQIHDMVHVEVWLGKREKTIGARWKKGVVQVHDSYKFVSKSYNNMKYYFCSIDTWLQGICKSYCPLHSWVRQKSKKKNNKRFCKDHPWKKRGGANNKFSIFSGSQSPDEQQDQEEDRVKEIRESIRRQRAAQEQEKKGEKESDDEEEEDCSSSPSYNQSQYSYTSSQTDNNYSYKGSCTRSRYTPSIVDIYPFKAPIQPLRPHTVGQVPIGYGSLGYVPSILRCSTSNYADSHQELTVIPIRNRIAKPKFAPRYGPSIAALKSSKQTSPSQPRRKYPSKTSYKKSQNKCVEILKYSVLNSQIKNNEKQNGSKKSIASGGSPNPLADPSTDSFISLWNNVNFGKWTQAVSVVQREPNQGYVRWQRDVVKGRDVHTFKSRPLFRAKVS